ncbi:DUF2064 domain-containing protein [uncultured Neptuniibacter sp.]|uniref:TIGR04282 family arsenosugar biosynthesis glycosyltransferase n=1 Tax=uncultured Neptuniibacter sp. TaxID=502143 RepID=UPI00262DEE22|nr:DUF2064 domain-containing protein [uncultured Neptuniibacter sp.]
MTNRSDTTLLIFCKKPRLHQGKQRIAATLGPEVALDIARALLNCAIEDAGHWQGPVVLSPSSEQDRDWAERLLPGVTVVVQPEGNLGERIVAVDNHLRDSGHQRILIIGSDAPILDHSYLREAAKGLVTSDVVLSAAEDGGITLMASSSGWPDISDLPWSTDRLGEELDQACRAQHRSVSYIRPSYDIDLEADLIKLVKDLHDDERPSRQALLRLVNPLVGSESNMIKV